MGSYKNFQSKSAKHKKNRYGIYNPEFESAVKGKGFEEEDNFSKNLNKYIDFVSWARWNIDLWYDLITPETGGINLDLDQRVFLRSITRFVSTYGVFPRGYGKCVTGDSLIFTNDGLKEIGEYFNYAEHNKEFYIKKNINVINRYSQLESTNAGVYSGYQDTKKITTEEGFEIEGTYNHPILCINKNGKIIWKNLKDISNDDYVAISRNNNVWGNNTNLNYELKGYLERLSNSSRSKINKENLKPLNKLDEDFALILGYLIGDGCLTRDNVIIFTTIDDDILNKYKSFMENRLNLKVVQKTKKSIDYVIYGKLVREYFKQIGLGYKNAFEKEIPKVIMEAPKNIVAKFISGLFDTDGGISNSWIEFCTASEKLSKQLQVLLLNFGIISTRIKKYNKRFKTYSYRITIYGENINKFNKEIGFSCKRKQEKLNKICNKQRNTNKDIIPYQKDTVKNFVDEIRKKPNYSYKIKDKLYHVLKGNNQLTYNKLKYLLELDFSSECESYEELVEFFNLNYFFSKVKKVDNSRNHVYDLSLPKTHSFVSNGFISHNTMLEIMGMIHTAIWFPDIEISMTAQTRENAAKLVDEKWRELQKFYPLLKNEVESYRSSKDSVEMIFTSGGRIDILANQQSTKGARRKRLNVEESAQLNNDLFQDVLEPVVNVPRRTIGKKAMVNPEELNGQINFFTTSWFRGSDEYERSLKMIDDMANLKGVMVMGSDWQLACHYNRGEPKSKILEKKDKLSPTFFAMNYESRWIGVKDGALVDINKVMDLRTITSPEFKSNKRNDYIIAMDVARSDNESNNQSSIAVFKLHRSKNGRIKQIRLINLINLPNGLNFTDQAIELKRIRSAYKAKAVVIDGNGLGTAIIDEVLKDTLDPNTGESLGCWKTMNTEREPEINDAEEIVYDLHAQGINSDIIVNFIDMVESKKLLLLEKKDNANYDINDENAIKSIAPHLNTDALIEEIANLKLKKLSSGKYTVERVTKKIDRDRYSAVAYGLWYIKNYEDNYEQDEEYDFGFYFN